VANAGLLHRHRRQPILVDGHKIHFRHVQQLLWAAILTTLGTGAVAAVYYIVTQTDVNVAGHHLWYLKPGWDHLVSRSWWPVARHQIRDIGEGVIAAFAVHTFLVSGWRKHADERLAGTALARRVTLVAVCTLVLMAGGIALTTFVLPSRWLVTTGGQFDWVTLALGFVIVHIVRVLWRPVGNTINADFTEGAVYRAEKRDRDPLWVRLPLMPPSVRERFAWTRQEHGKECKPHFDVITKVLMLAVVVAFCLSVYGEYILHVVAKGG